MDKKTRLAALVGAGALLAAPLALVATASPAHADVERHGTCGAGRYELSVDREGTGWEVDAGLENVAPGSSWTFVLKQDGNRYLTVTRRADRQGDVDVDAYRRNTAGSDTFRFKAVPVGGGTGCSAGITVG